MTAAQHGFKAGDRVQTQWTVEEGGDDSWYSGTILNVLGDGRCKIKYDDGDSWTGDGRYVMRLAGAPGTGPIAAAAVVEVVDLGSTSVLTAAHVVQPVEATVVHSSAQAQVVTLVK